MAVLHQSPVVLFDIDGTLVDSNYHHVLAWSRAFRSVGIVAPAWKLHRHMGMGGDHLVPAVAGQEVEDRYGDELRERWTQEFGPMLHEIAPLDGARELLRHCADVGLQVVLASSGSKEHVEHYVDLLDARDVVHAWTTSDDVAHTKPSPDLLEVALRRSDGGQATMVGDSPWDVHAAQRAGIPAIGVLTGGFCRQDLQDAGAAAVVSTPEQLASLMHVLLAAA